MIGIVKFFNSSKGWGFVSDDETHEDYFVHYSNIRMEGFKQLKEGQKVTFDKDEESKDRPNAKNVRVVQVLEERE